MSVNPIGGLIGKLGERLRFPQLFVLTATLFFVDLIVPDLIPFIDELLLGLATLLLANWRKPKLPEAPEQPLKDVTPRDN